MANVDIDIISKIENQVGRLDHVRANLEVIALGMRGDMLGSDVPAVAAYVDMLEVIHKDMMSILDTYHAVWESCRWIWYGIRYLINNLFDTGFSLVVMRHRTMVREERLIENSLIITGLLIVNPIICQ